MKFTNKSGEVRIARGDMQVSKETQWQVPSQSQIDKAIEDGYTCINCFAEGSNKEAHAYVTMTVDEIQKAIDAESTHFTLKPMKTKVIGL